MLMKKRNQGIAVCVIAIILGAIYIKASMSVKGVIVLYHKHKLCSLLDKLPMYQPAYGVSLPNKYIANRSSLDRAKLIEQDLEYHLKYNNLSILDLGSNIGYMSFYFSSLGSKVTGVDKGKDYIEAAKIIAKMNGLPVQFHNKDIDLNFIKELEYNYDCAFLLSVVHHIHASKGLAYTQKLISELSKKFHYYISS